MNSWIGEQFRTIGIEAGLQRRGRPVGSLHDVGFSVAAFRANDPGWLRRLVGGEHNALR